MPKGFFQYGHADTDLSDSTYEDFLVADREGLEHLRTKLDEVLSGADEVTFDPEVTTDLNGIKVASYIGGDSAIDSVWDKIAPIGCLLIFVVGLVLTGLGVWKVWEFLH